MFRLLLVSLVGASLAACSWVQLDRGAQGVLVLPPDRLAPACTSLGKVTVSVLDKVGVLERHDEEVVEDLHVLARNHAAKQGGDTVVALGEAEDGARQYEVWRCMQGDTPNSMPAPDGEGDSVEVLPYEGD